LFEVVRFLVRKRLTAPMWRLRSRVDCRLLSF